MEALMEGRIGLHFYMKKTLAEIAAPLFVKSSNHNTTLCAAIYLVLVIRCS